MVYNLVEFSIVNKDGKLMGGHYYDQIQATCETYNEAVDCLCGWINDYGVENGEYADVVNNTIQLRTKDGKLIKTYFRFHFFDRNKKAKEGYLIPLFENNEGETNNE